MKTGSVIAIVLVLVLLAGGVAYLAISAQSATGQVTSSGSSSSSSSSSSGTTTPISSPGQTYNVDITNTSFTPEMLTIQPGDTIIWTNTDNVTHNVTSDSGTELNSMSIAPGQTYTHTFTNEGTYNYFDSGNPNLIGSIVVSSTATPSPTTTVSSTPQTDNISINNYTFTPQTLTINVGDTVIWTNMDSVTHTVTSTSGSELNSGNIATGQTYTHTFTTAGTYDYYCSIHPNMTGTITVVNPSSSSTTTSSSSGGSSGSGY